MSSNSSSTSQTSRRKKLVFGSRKSALAQWQTARVGQCLVSIDPDLQFVIKHVSTRGDEQIDQPLPEIGGKGLFTAELDRALLDHDIDVAVHSLKDLPTQVTPGLTIVPVLEREDPGDVLVSSSGQTLAQLPAGATVGTSSYRRQSQLLAVRPDLQVQPIRGNVPTRIAKLDQESYEAVILAAAGILRLGLAESIADRLPLEVMLPAPGQAFMAATCRADDLATRSLLTSICNQQAFQCATAEREFLSALGGGCSAPIAAYAQFTAPAAKELLLIGRVASLDGRIVITRQAEGHDPRQVANQVAELILASGGSQLLASLGQE